jgi:aspartate/methionine/tyrosine aminotransferase
VSDQFAKNFELLAATITKMGHEVCCADGDAGGYFLVADVHKSGMDGMAFSKWLAAEKGVACVPLMVFYQGRPEDDPFTCTLVRFAICKPQETIETACQKLLV